MLEFHEDDFIDVEVENVLDHLNNDVLVLDGLHFNTMLEGLSNEMYHSHEATSSTQLPLMGLSNTIYDNRKFFQVRKNAYDIGSLIHDAILLPDLVDKDYIECETVGMSTKQADKQREENPDKVVVGQGDIDTAKTRAKLVHLIFGWLLFNRNTKKEVSFFHKYEAFNVTIRIRPDILNLNWGMLQDFKTTKAENQREFEKLIEPYNYHVSLAFYFDALVSMGHNMIVERCGWICQSNSEPYLVFGVRITEELLEKGRSIYQNRLKDYFEFKQNQAQHGEDDINLLFDDLFSYSAHSFEYRKSNY